MTARKMMPSARTHAQTARYSPSQQSDLRLFERMESLTPSNLIAAFNRLQRRTRVVIVMAAAALVIMWGVTTLIGQLALHVENTRGPFMSEALTAPYSLQARVFALGDLEMPTVVDPFGLQEVITETQLQDAEKQNVLPIELTLGACLVTKVIEAERPCQLTIPAEYLVTGRYLDAEGRTVYATAARFVDPTVTTDAMQELFVRAHSMGRTGDFVIGVMDVSYFYSQTRGANQFAWTHGQWLFLVSGVSYQGVEAWVQNFTF